MTYMRPPLFITANGLNSLVISQDTPDPELAGAFKRTALPENTWTFTDVREPFVFFLDIPSASC